VLFFLEQFVGCYTLAEGSFGLLLIGFIFPENLKNAGVAKKCRAWFNRQVLTNLRYFYWPGKHMHAIFMLMIISVVMFIEDEVCLKLQ